MNSKIEELHAEAVTIAARFHKDESRLISIFQEMDGHSQFKKLNCSSLFDYGVRILKLSESNTYNFITLARKSKIIPELKQAIDFEELSVSKARKITSVITTENKDHWINLAKTLPKVQLEKEVAKVSPQQLVQEKIQYVSSDRVKLTVGISEEVLDLLKRVQDLESQRTRQSANYEDTIKTALKVYIEKLDPLKKAKRCLAKQEGSSSNKQVPGQVPFVRTPIPQNLKHEINSRDKGICTHKVEDGKRCQNSRWTQIHHIIPVSRGGTNALSNLTTLCSSHHRQMHQH